MVYEHGSYTDISVIYDFLGKDLCEYLLSFHAVTGCDTTSYLFNVGKVRTFRKLLSYPANSYLLKSLEQVQPLSNDDVSDLMKFVQTVMYSGQKEESYLNTRVRLYKQQKENTPVITP